MSVANIILHIPPGWPAIVRAPFGMTIDVRLVQLTVVRTSGPVVVTCHYGDDMDEKVPRMFKSWPLDGHGLLVDGRMPPGARSMEFDVNTVAEEPIVEEARRALERSPLTIVRLLLECDFVTRETAEALAAHRRTQKE